MNENPASHDRVTRRHFLILISLVAILVFLLAGQLWLNYQERVRTAEINTRDIISVFHTRLDSALRRLEADLTAISASLPHEALDRNATARHAGRVRELLDRDNRLSNVEEMLGYCVYDAEGNLLYLSDTVKTPHLRAADRNFFVTQQVRQDAEMAFSDVYLVNGQYFFMVAHRVQDKEGSLKGFVRGIINLDYYREQFKTLNLGKQGLASLRRSDTHALVARYPERPHDINHPLSDGHPMAISLNMGKTKTLHYVFPEDSIARIISMRKLGKYPFYFAVGISKDEVLSGWWTQARIAVISTFLVCILIAVLLVRLARMQARENRMLATLAQSESQFRRLAQMVPVGICRLNAESRYTYLNDRYMLISGRMREELLGMEWGTFIPQKEWRKIRSAWLLEGEARNSLISEFRCQRPDGSTVFVQGAIHAERDDAGEILGYIVAMTDISQRKRAEEDMAIARRRAESESKEKTQLLAAASHDLRQPVQAIKLFRDALNHTDLNPEQQTISDFLSLSIHSLAELLYSLLDLSKLDAGKIVPNPVKVKLEDIFNTLNNEFSNLALQKKNFHFKIFYPGQDIVLFTDQTILLCVLRNLVDNACKYTEKGGVLVGFRKRKGNALIQVWDTGVGIDTSYGDRIYDEYFQIGNDAHDRSKGLGLGLPIARRKVRLLGGELVYRSRPGRGSVFEIVLPMNAPNVD